MDQKEGSITAPERSDSTAFLDRLGQATTAESLQTIFSLIRDPVALYRGEGRYRPSSLGEAFTGHKSAAVFAATKTGGLLRFLHTRIRVWDQSYRNLGIARDMIEDVYRLKCLNFLATMEGNFQAMGEAAREFSKIERMSIWLQATGVAGCDGGKSG
ncbi:MAG: hypothetical protein Q9210_000042 [Variospora velana]